MEITALMDLKENGLQMLVVKEGVRIIETTTTTIILMIWRITRTMELSYQQIYFLRNQLHRLCLRILH